MTGDCVSSVNARARAPEAHKGAPPTAALKITACWSYSPSTSAIHFINFPFFSFSLSILVLLFRSVEHNAPNQSEKAEEWEVGISFIPADL